MISTFRTGRLLLIVIILFISAEGADVIYRSDLKYSLKTSVLNRLIVKREKKGAECLENLKANFKTPDLILDRIAKHAAEGNYSVLHYSDSNLVLWTDNSFGASKVLDTAMFSKRLVQMNGRWLAVNKISEANETFICLISIWHDYQIENEIVKSGFEGSFRMPDGASLTTDIIGDYPVYGRNDDYLFSVNYDNCNNFNTWFSIIPLVLWLSTLGVILVLINKMASFVAMKGYGVAVPFIVMLVSGVIYLVMVLTGKPDFIFGFSIFSPYRFSLGKLIPSPGHMLLAGLGFVYAAWSFYKWFPIHFRPDGRATSRLAILTIYLFIGVMVFYLYTLLVSKFITGSNINFDIHKVLGIDYFTVTAFLASSFIMIGLILYLLKIMRSAEEINDRTLFMAGGLSSLFIFLVYALRGDNPFIQLVAWSGLVFAARLFRNPGSGIINISVIFGLIAAAYASYIIPAVTWDRETENLKVMAVNYSNDNDLYAESLLHDAWPELIRDTILSQMMSMPFFTSGEADKVYEYLDKRYFSAYWENYERIYTICNYDSELILEGKEDSTANCFGFFESRMAESGLPLIDSGLVFIENNSGRAYYMGCLYFDAVDGNRNGLFFELVNKIKYIQSGYPELLVDKKYFLQPLLRKYSIAKYVNDTLVMQTGSLPFDQLLSVNNDFDNEYVITKARGVDYLIFNRTDKVSLVIARPSFRFLDIMVTFTYFFVGFFLLLMLSIFLIHPYNILKIRKLEFRHKMQLAFLFVLLGTMIAVGSVVIYLSIGQYRAKHLENIREKLSSVTIELEHKLSGESSIDQGWSAEGYPSLDDLLIKFSNVFYTDINLFDNNGNLLASSRREIFEKNLSGSRMNFFALDALKRRGESQYIHQEEIGQLLFLSAYIPFLNEDNQLLAYLNLPYFNMQSKLTEEVSNLVVAIINFSLILLVISMAVAVFISGRITSPLRMLQDGLASVKLGRHSEPLEYKGKDEIGELVNQYNVMLGELHESAIKLARSEREDAWREMAKQIAHEIKNPLTPMKLNVQQLFKSWKDGSDDFETRLARFTENQIEQIDNLSSIATEFSNFARMPKAKPGQTDLISAVKNVSQLFADIRKIDIVLETNELMEVIIYADREQLSSMLNNLIRNAVQSIPSNRKGRISIDVKIVQEKVLLSITDNGSGIAPELREKLFLPNFTTKSSGMGLGLAIVKRIVETANGRIWFESGTGEGTVFYVEYPFIEYK